MILDQMELFALAGALLVAGMAGGFVAGLLGVGGGIIIVPVLYYLLGLFGIDENVRMHIATGTSLATIIPTSFSSIRSHNRKGAIDWTLVKRWMPWMVVGVCAGSLLSGLASGDTLSLVFAAVALPIALQFMILKDKADPVDSEPHPIRPYVPAFLTGGLSTMMGIGGGTIGVPVLTYVGNGIHRSVGTASVFGAIISIPGTLGAIIAGWGAEGLPPYSLGYVNLLGLALIAPTSFLLAPLGARAAHAMNRKWLRLAFAAFLLATAIRMILNAID